MTTPAGQSVAPVLDSDVTLANCLSPNGLHDICLNGTWSGSYTVNGTPGTLTWSRSQQPIGNGTFSGSVYPVQGGYINFGLQTDPGVQSGGITFYRVFCTETPPSPTANPGDPYDHTLSGDWSVSGPASISGSMHTTVGMTQTCSRTVTLNMTIAPPAAATNPTPANGGSVVEGKTGPTLQWTAAAGAWFYDIYYGTTNPPPLAGHTSQTSWGAPFVSAGTIYWQVVARNGSGSTAGPVWTFALSTAPGV